MERERCIFCEKLLEKDPSDEHLIAENIGGKLHSKNLICGECNSKFGTILDENLRKRFENIIFWINFKKEKFDKKLDVKLEKKDYVFIPKKGPKLKHPIFKNINGKNIPVSFPTMKDRANYYKSQNINEKKGLDSLKPEIKEGFFLFERMTEKENELTWRACGKIVYEFLNLFKTNYHPSNTKFIEFVMGKLNSNEFPLNIAILNNYIPLKKNKDKIYHLIIIEGRKEEKIIIGYLDLFDSLKVIILIDENYNGESFVKGYYHDLMQSNECGYFDPQVLIPLNKIRIKKMVKCYPQDSDLNKCFRKSVETEYKARFFPFKKLAENIKDEIELKQNLNLLQIEQIEKKISVALKEWGFQIDYVITADIKYEYLTPLQKIISMLKFLHLNFLLLDMDTSIFKKLLSMFLYKELYFNK